MGNEKNLQASYMQESAPAHLNEKTINQLFVRLGSNYAHLWTSQWRTDELFDAARKEWAMELGKFDNGIIGMALRKCKVKHIDHPPTLPQFAAICKSCAANIPQKSEYKCLEQTRTPPKKAKENIAKIREAISGADILTK